MSWYHIYLGISLLCYLLCAWQALVNGNFIKRYLISILTQKRVTSYTIFIISTMSDVKILMSCIVRSKIVKKFLNTFLAVLIFTILLSFFAASSTYATTPFPVLEYHYI